MEEFESGAKPMEGVGTSTAGFVGLAERGPVVGLPQLVTNFSDFKRIYGGYLSDHEFGGYRFKIQAMRRRRISNIRVTREVCADNAPAVQAEDDAGRDPAEAAAENAEHPASH